MPATLQPDRDVPASRHDLDRLSGLIKKWVLDGLGHPADLHEVQVRPLWPHHYRVNVLVGANAAAVNVAHSFFLVANSDGDIVGSTPGITKQY